MDTTALAADLDRLADAIATRRVAPGADTLICRARQARRVGAPRGLVDALADATSAQIVAERAAVLLAAWLRRPSPLGSTHHPAVTAELCGARRPARAAQPVSC